MFHEFHRVRTPRRPLTRLWTAGNLRCKAAFATPGHLPLSPETVYTSTSLPQFSRSRQTNVLTCLTFADHEASCPNLIRSPTRVFAHLWELLVVAHSGRPSAKII